MATKNFFMTFALVASTNAAVYGGAIETVTSSEGGAAPPSSGVSLYQALNSVFDGGLIKFSQSGQKIAVNFANNYSLHRGTANISFTIEGNNTTITKGSGGNGRFVIDSGATNVSITVKNMRFANYNTSSADSGILFNIGGGQITFDNCTFDSMCCAGSSAIVNYSGRNGSVLKFNKCKFTNISADNCLFMSNGNQNNGTKAVFKECIFRNCGTIVIRNITAGTPVVSDSMNDADVVVPQFNQASDVTTFGNTLVWRNIGATPRINDIKASYSIADSTLIISGTGNMRDLAVCPWRRTTAGGISVNVIEVLIPDRITKIGKKAFEKCTALRKVIMNGIGEKVAQIDDRAFAECTSLKSISLTSEIPPAVATNTFEGITKPNVDLFVFTPTVYKTSSAWLNFNIIDMGCGNCN